MFGWFKKKETKEEEYTSILRLQELIYTTARNRKPVWDHKGFSYNFNDVVNNIHKIVYIELVEKNQSELTRDRVIGAIQMAFLEEEVKLEDLKRLYIKEYGM